MKELCRTSQISFQYSLCELEGLKIISKTYLDSDYLRAGCFKTVLAFLSKYLEFILYISFQLYAALTVYGCAIYFSYTIWHNLCFSILLSTRQKFFFLYFNLSVYFFARQRKRWPCMVIIYQGWENGGCEDESRHLLFFHLIRENLWKHNWAILRQNDQWSFSMSN